VTTSAQAMKWELSGTVEGETRTQSPQSRTVSAVENSVGVDGAFVPFGPPSGDAIGEIAVAGVTGEEVDMALSRGRREVAVHSWVE